MATNGLVAQRRVGRPASRVRKSFVLTLDRDQLDFVANWMSNQDMTQGYEQVAIREMITVLMAVTPEIGFQSAAAARAYYTTRTWLLRRVNEFLDELRRDVKSQQFDMGVGDGS